MRWDSLARLDIVSPQDASLRSDAEWNPFRNHSSLCCWYVQAFALGALEPVMRRIARFNPQHGRKTRSEIATGNELAPKLFHAGLWEAVDHRPRTAACITRSGEAASPEVVNPAPITILS